MSYTPEQLLDPQLWVAAIIAMVILAYLIHAIFGDRRTSHPALYDSPRGR
jgi:hypothetical protein